ncbi:hypothetical protein [Streptomyces sp. HUAS ZL42]|uniref:hypothetical protein n=1 Tax=Streptomyces sp. HUAS ZL42 TaxID=3231715 RepID=UPI00345EA839
MAKYLYGAFEPPDNALALLAARKHIKQRRMNESSNARRDYYLFPKGQAAAAAMREEVPPVQWCGIAPTRRETGRLAPTLTERSHRRLTSAFSHKDAERRGGAMAGCRGHP